MADIKSLETLLNELKIFLRAYNRRVDTGDNSLSKDLLLYPYSVGGKIIMDQVEIARDLHILSRLESSDLDNEGTNYRKERLTGTYAVVTLTFFTTNDPTGEVVIPENTICQTIGTSFSSPTTFSVINTYRFAFANMSAYFSYDRNRYEFPVQAICQTIGTIGNVGSNNITKIAGTVSGIQGVTNLIASTGGTDQEIDDDLRKRIQLAATGRDLNTLNGVRSFIRDMGFLDGYSVRVEDIDSERADGVDIFVVTNMYESQSETFTYDPLQIRYYFTKRPVLEVTSVVGPLGTLSTAQYDVELDTTSPLKRSIYSNDYIRIQPAAALSVGDSFTVTYNYANMIDTVQDTFKLNENDVLTANVLIKRAYPLYLYITASLSLKANSDGPATRTKCRNALAQYCSTFRLGDELQKSDLIVLLQTGFGDYPVDTVDSLIISTYYLKDEYGNIISPVNENLSVGNKQYVVYGSATII